MYSHRNWLKTWDAIKAIVSGIFSRTSMHCLAVRVKCKYTHTARFNCELATPLYPTPGLVSFVLISVICCREDKRWWRGENERVVPLFVNGIVRPFARILIDLPPLPPSNRTNGVYTLGRPTLSGLLRDPERLLQCVCTFSYPIQIYIRRVFCLNPTEEPDCSYLIRIDRGIFVSPFILFCLFFLFFFSPG